MLGRFIWCWPVVRDCCRANHPFALTRDQYQLRLDLFNDCVISKGAQSLIFQLTYSEIFEMATQNRVFGQFEDMEVQARNIVSSHPLSTVATAFGLGLFAGVVGITVFQSITSRTIAERIGHRLVDKLADMTPSSWGL